MPPRYAYWTILAGGLPTAFRAAERDELLPTFKRILEKHPDAQMKYFARGKLWDSREASQASLDRRPPERRGRPEGDRRGRDWRPGGEHRDPRQKFKDAKKDRNLAWRKERFDRKNWPPRDRPHADTVGDRAAGAPPRQAQWRPRPETPRAHPKSSPRMRELRDWRERPPREKPHDDPLRGQHRPFVRQKFERNQGTEEPRTRPRRPHREPWPDEVPKPGPRPRDPSVLPTGPPERGRGPRSRFPKGGRPPKDRGRR